MTRMTDVKTTSTKSKPFAQKTIATSTGARVENTYLVRKQEIVGVNKHDLEDLKDIDGIQSFFSNIGMFFLAGAFWVGVENAFDEEGFLWTPLMIGCTLCVAFGLVFVLVGWHMRRRKIGKITRIFGEVEQYEPSFVVGN
jgi:hypothetical protein